MNNIWITASTLMNKASERKLINQTRTYVKKRMLHEAAGHDWAHVERVYHNALIIAHEEKANIFIVSLAALLHDIADYKFHNGDNTVGPRHAACWLKDINVPPQDILHITAIIRELSFKGAGVFSKMPSLEGKIVQDADRLEAIGAIGIARTFMYAGQKGKTLYDPKIKPTKHKTFAAYKNNKSTAINHFYEKLLLLKDLMHTGTARKMARARHDLMRQFLHHFFAEQGLPQPKLQ